MTTPKFKVLAIAGKSGAGKDSLCRELIKKFPDKFNPLVSCTTRPKREGEVEGHDYFFVSKSTFERMLLDGNFIEACVFNDWGYGTPAAQLLEEKINVGVFNPEGIETLAENPLIDLKVIYLLVDSKERLLRQLNREEHPNVDEIVRRYLTDEKDFKFLSFEDNVITCANNNKKDFKNAVRKALEIW